MTLEQQWRDWSQANSVKQKFCSWRFAKEHIKDQYLKIKARYKDMVPILIESRVLIAHNEKTI